MGIAQSVSVCKGHGSMAHNNREFITPNVDQSRTHLNVTYVKEPLAEAYRKIFGAELDRYNASQTRSDRKIHNYIEHIKNSKNGEKPFYETVVQIGNKYTCNVLSKNGELAAKILDEFMRDFQRRNPNLYVFNAVLHLDEQTPHIHIDYIPVARGYKKGLQIRNSLDKALRQQGVPGTNSKKNNATQHWQEGEKKALAEVMARYDWERAAESGLGREKLTVNQYKATMAEIESRVETLPDQIERKPAPLAKGKVVVDAAALEALEMRAKLSRVYDEAQQAIQDKITAKLDEVADYSDQGKLLIQQQLDAARKEKAKAESISIHAGQALADAHLKERQATERYNELQGLPEAYKAAQRQIEALQGQIETLRADSAELQHQIQQKDDQLEAAARNVDRKVEEAIRPFLQHIDALTSRMEGMAKAEAILLKAVRFVADRLAGETSFRILDAMHRLGNRWLREDGFANLVSNEAKITASLAKELKLQLVYDKSGAEGRGLYTKNGTCIVNVESLKEARERFPGCQIERAEKSNEEHTR